MKAGASVRACRLSWLAVAAVSVSVAAACGGQASLTVIERGGSGPPTLVLLHGYGARAEQWLPFVDTIQLPAGGRLVFPQAPQSTRLPGVPPGGRGWWPLGLADYVPVGGGVPDISATKPAGIKTAAAFVRTLLEDVRASSGRPILLGGFSQGAMVSGEVAFMSDEPIDGLILLSGTSVDEASWIARLPERRGLPVFIAHGRADPTLPFAVAERLKDALIDAGLDVTWHPFDGGHQVPAEVVDGLNRFIVRVLSEPRTASAAPARPPG